MIAAIGAVLVLTSAFVPSWSVRVAGVTLSTGMSSVRKGILVAACIISLISLLSKRLMLLYPVCTIAIGCASAESLAAAYRYMQMTSSVREILADIAKIYYSPVFVTGFVIMTVVSVVLAMRLLLGRKGE